MYHITTGYTINDNNPDNIVDTVFTTKKVLFLDNFIYNTNQHIFVAVVHGLSCALGATKEVEDAETVFETGGEKYRLNFKIEDISGYTYNDLTGLKELIEKIK